MAAELRLTDPIRARKFERMVQRANRDVAAEIVEMEEQRCMRREAGTAAGRAGETSMVTIASKGLPP